MASKSNLKGGFLTARFERTYFRGTSTQCHDMELDSSSPVERAWGRDAQERIEKLWAYLREQGGPDSCGVTDADLPDPFAVRGPKDN